MSSISVNVDIDDIIWGLCASDKESLVKELVESGEFDEWMKKNPRTYGHRGSMLEDMFISKMELLIANYPSLTVEEIQTIETLAKRF